MPLVSSKVITLERAYPITLGANLGTTATSIIAALSFNGGRTAFRLSLCHFFFNFSGILVFFIVPQLHPSQLAYTQINPRDTARRSDEKPSESVHPSLRE